MKATKSAASLFALAHFSAALVALTAPDAGAYLTKDGEDVTFSWKDAKEAIENIQKNFSEIKSAQDELDGQVKKFGSADPLTEDKVKKIAEESAVLKQVKEDLELLQKRMSRPGAFGGTKDGEQITPEQEEHRKAFEDYIRDPHNHTKETALRNAEKAVSTSTDAAGGHAVPEVIGRQIEREMTEAQSVRNLVRVVNAGTKDYKELFDLGGMGYGWVGEGDTRTETGTPTLAEIAPTFGTLYAYPKASEESLDDMFFDVQSWLVSSAVEAFLEAEEDAVFNGNGTKKPTGLLAATLSTDDDSSRTFGEFQKVISGSDTTITFDGITNLMYSLKKQHRSNAKFVQNKATSGVMMTIKDADGNYLWQPPLQLGQPDRFRGYEVDEREVMPDIAGDATPIAFGDFRKAYLLVPLHGLRITRDEITTPGFVKWYIRRRVGGITKNSNAVKFLEITDGQA